VEINLGNYDLLLDLKTNLRNSILEYYLNYINDGLIEYEANITLRLSSLLKFSNFSCDFGAYRRTLLKIEDGSKEA
jgi:hypothetical protein